VTIYDKLRRRPAAFRSLAGVSVREFDQLHEQVADRLESDEAMMGDKGYQGIQHAHPSVLPHKKPKGGELTDEQKAFNRRLSKARVVVENTICQIKTFRVMADRYRHPRDSRNDVFNIVAALVNRRIQRRPLRTVLA
jgi:transposase